MLIVSDGFMIGTPSGIRSSSCDEEDGVDGRPWLHRGLAVWTGGLSDRVAGRGWGFDVAENERWKFQMCPLYSPSFFLLFGMFQTPVHNPRVTVTVSHLLLSISPPKIEGWSVGQEEIDERWNVDRPSYEGLRVFFAKLQCFLLTPTCRFTFLSWFWKTYVHVSEF